MTTTGYQVYGHTTKVEGPTSRGLYWWECSCGDDGVANSNRRIVVYNARHHTEERSAARQLLLQRANRESIEIHFGGHGVKIVKGDHQALRWLTRRGTDLQYGNPALAERIRALEFDHRVCLCSCGSIMVFDTDNVAYNARRATVAAEAHCKRSTREPRDYKWTKLRGWVPKANALREEEAMPVLPNAVSRRDVLRARRDEIEAELARLATLPGEPTVLSDPDGTTTNVVWFEKTFGGMHPYTYAAVRCGDGLWYTTGPKAPKGYGWDRLVEWINDDEPEPVAIWHATEWVPLTPES